MDVPVHLREVDLGTGRVDAEWPCVPDRIRPLGCGQQRLRRHTAGVEAVAAHFALLDEHNRHAKGGGAGRDRQAARARADDADVGSQSFGHGRAFCMALIRTSW